MEVVNVGIMSRENYKKRTIGHGSKNKEFALQCVVAQLNKK